MSQRADQEHVRIRAARPDEIGWLYAWLVENEPWELVRQTEPAGSKTPAPPRGEGWWVAEVAAPAVDNRPVGAIRIEKLPGAIAALLGPRLAPGTRSTVARQLVEHATTAIGQAPGVSLIQSLRRPDDPLVPTELAACGFRRITGVAFLLWPVAPVEGDGLAAELRVDPIALPVRGGEGGSTESVVEPGSRSDRLIRVLRETYTDSYDFPELQNPGWEEQLVGARPSGPEYETSATGVGGPLSAWIVRYGQADVGCVVYQQNCDKKDAQCVYLGLVPAFRGRRWGRSLLRFLQAQAARDRCERLYAECDMRNSAALRSYAAAGFFVYDQQDLWIYEVK